MWHETLFGRVAVCCFFFFQAEDGIRDLVRSRGLGDVYKRQPDVVNSAIESMLLFDLVSTHDGRSSGCPKQRKYCCLLYTSDAADERSSVDLGGRRIIKKKKQVDHVARLDSQTTKIKKLNKAQ